MRILLGQLLLLILLTAVLSAQVVSTEVYRSREEIREAFQLGEIDYYQYLALLELIEDEVGRSESWMLDQVPNLTYFDSTSRSARTKLQLDQLQGFDPTGSRSSAPRMQIKYRYFQGMDEQEDFGYNFGSTVFLAQHWRASTQLKREKSGRERLVSRSVVYQSSSSKIRTVRIGSFRTRLGLGTVYGYRGKLLDYSEHIDSESLLYPDYGGFNGLLVESEFSGTSVELLGSVTRDSLHSLQTAGGMVSRSFDRWRTGLIWGLSRLKNRVSDESLADLKVGLYNKLEYSAGYVSAEVTTQRSADYNTGAISAEGKHHFEQATLKYAFWSYGREFLNLTSGSKAANLRHPVIEERTEFSATDKLSGQKGGLIKTLVKLAESWELTSSSIFGFRGSDSSHIEFMGSLKHAYSDRLSLRADYLARRRQKGPGRSGLESDGRARIEVRLNLGRFQARSYIGYRSVDKRADYWSFFGSVRYQTVGMGEIEIWSNVGRIKDGQIDYWYFYVRHKQELSESMVLSIKVVDSFSRSRPDRHRPLLAIDLAVRL